jgi:uncharacterized protein YcfL
MKKLILFLTIMVIVGCRKTPFIPELPKPVDNSLKIENSVGIKLQSPFVTSEVAMNVKVETSQTVNIRILDIANRVVSKEEVYLNTGDNILKVYTAALPVSAYRIGLYDRNGVQLGITDFNKQ